MTDRAIVPETRVTEFATCPYCGHSAEVEITTYLDLQVSEYTCPICQTEVEL